MRVLKRALRVQAKFSQWWWSQDNFLFPIIRNMYKFILIIDFTNFLNYRALKVSTKERSQQGKSKDIYSLTGQLLRLRKALLIQVPSFAKMYVFMQYFSSNDNFCQNKNLQWYYLCTWRFLNQLVTFRKSRANCYHPITVQTVINYVMYSIMILVVKLMPARIALLPDFWLLIMLLYSDR